MKIHRALAIAAALAACVAVPAVASAAAWTDVVGNNAVFAMGATNDVMHGLDFDDQLKGGAGNDVIYGEIGNDKLWGEAGNDKVYGNDQDDKLFGGTGADLLDGGNGNDEIRSDEADMAADQIDCGPGFDTVYYHGEDAVKNCEVKHLVR